ncbi:MAG: hypothetical protein ACOC8M_03095 [Guyparkeria sp.]
MSTSGQLDSGGTSGDGTADDDPRRPTNFQGVVTDDEGNVIQRITLPPWLLSLRPLAGLVDVLVAIATRPRAFVVASIVGISITEAAGRLARGESAAAIIVEDYIFEQLLAPAGAFLFAQGRDAVLALGIGFDFFASIPRGVAGLGAGGILEAAGGAATAVESFNRGLVEPVTALGLGAQPAATAIGAVEIAGVAWLLWILVRTIDVPVVDPVGSLSAFTRPFRNFIGGLFGR